MNTNVTHGMPLPEPPSIEKEPACVTGRDTSIPL